MDTTETVRADLSAALHRYKEAKRARGEFARPDGEVERGVWRAAVDALRVCARSEASEGVPAELATDLARVLESVIGGSWPEELKAARRRRPDLPGGQRAHYVEDAVRYLVACREGIIRGLTLDQAVAEVADEYEVSAATVGKWMKTVTGDWRTGARLLGSLPYEVPEDLIGRDLATRIDAIMRRSGYGFRRWPRLEKSLA